MSTIDVRRAHTLPKEEAQRRAEELAQSMQERFEIEWHWQGDRIVFETPRGVAKGTRGSVDVSEGEVRVQIDLPLILRVLRATVESKVHEKLARVL
jgi:putative polyhydroxyalkanoate system protein